MTQEQLAEILSISPQAVSRWETDAAMPDISMLPAICNLFDVSADELLGIGIENKERKILETSEKAGSFSRRGYNEEAKEILEAGLREFPNSYKLMNDLVHVYYNLRSSNGDGEGEDYQKKALELGNRILESCTVDSFRYSATQILCFIHKDNGDFDKAKELANNMPSMAVSRESLLAIVTQGEEQLTRKRIALKRYLELFSAGLNNLNTRLDNGEWTFTDGETALLRDKRIAIVDVMFEDGDFGFFHTHLCATHQDQAKYYAKIKDEEKTVYHLSKAAEHAISFVTAEKDREHTSLFLRGRKIGGFSTNNSDNDALWLLSELGEPCFDFVRDNGDFVKVKEVLKKYAQKWQVET